MHYVRGPSELFQHSIWTSNQSHDIHVINMLITCHFSWIFLIVFHCRNWLKSLDPKAMKGSRATKLWRSDRMNQIFTQILRWNDLLLWIHLYEMIDKKTGDLLCHLFSMVTDYKFMCRYGPSTADCYLNEELRWTQIKVPTQIDFPSWTIPYFFC